MLLLFLTLGLTSIFIASTSAYTLDTRALFAPYAPYTFFCSSQPRSRAADSLGSGEAQYVSQRRIAASQALSSWISKTLNIQSLTGSTIDVPTVALALSGGGAKAGLTTAGTVQALDSRDSKSAVAGLLQGMTYMSALSGGSLTLAGMMVNDFSQISTLKRNLYNSNYAIPLTSLLPQRKAISYDVFSKVLSGYPTTRLDIYGRCLAINFIGGFGNADGENWSGLLNKPSFRNYQAPYPIATLTDAKVPQGQCQPNQQTSVWEVSPFEFGSWDQGVNAFFPSNFLGTPQSSRGTCTLGLDNIGFFTGISANLLFSGVPSECQPDGTGPLSTLANLLGTVYGLTTRNSGYGILPNPFYDASASPSSTASQKELFMTDGGNNGQGIPITPFLQPARQIDVIFAIDAQSTTPQYITNGSSLYVTSQAAKRNGLTRMPSVPTPDQFLAQKLNSRAQFFGCDDRNVATIIYIPNTYSTQIPGEQFLMDSPTLEAVFQSGSQAMTQNNTANWPACLACGIMQKKTPTLPDVCTKCLQTYCWKP